MAKKKVSRKSKTAKAFRPVSDDGVVRTGVGGVRSLGGQSRLLPSSGGHSPIVVVRSDLSEAELEEILRRSDRATEASRRGDRAPGVNSIFVFAGAASDAYGYSRIFGSGDLLRGIWLSFRQGTQPANVDGVIYVRLFKGQPSNAAFQTDGYDLGVAYPSSMYGLYFIPVNSRAGEDWDCVGVFVDNDSADDWNVGVTFDVFRRGAD